MIPQVRKERAEAALVGEEEGDDDESEDGDPVLDAAEEDGSASLEEDEEDEEDVEESTTDRKRSRSQRSSSAKRPRISSRDGGRLEDGREVEMDTDETSSLELVSRSPVCVPDHQSRSRS